MTSSKTYGCKGLHGKGGEFVGATAGIRAHACHAMPVGTRSTACETGDRGATVSCARAAARHPTHNSHAQSCVLGMQVPEQHCIFLSGQAMVALQKKKVLGGSLGTLPVRPTKDQGSNRLLR